MGYEEASSKKRGGKTTSHPPDRTGMGCNSNPSSLHHGKPATVILAMNITLIGLWTETPCLDSITDVVRGEAASRRPIAKPGAEE